MKRRPRECLAAVDVGVSRHPQDTGRGDQHVEWLLAGGGREPPLPSRYRAEAHLGAEPDVGPDVSFVGYLPEVRLDLRARRQKA